MDQIKAIMLIRAFRIRGHLQASIDPLNLVEKTYHPELDPETYGFTDADMDRPIFINYVLGLEIAHAPDSDVSGKPIAALSG